MISNVGDSRAVMGTRDHDGHLTALQLTVDLKPNLPGILTLFLCLLLPGPPTGVPIEYGSRISFSCHWVNGNIVVLLICKI